MRPYCLVFLASLFLLAGCTPSEPTQNWFRGNLHTHSLWSDGDDYPEMIMDWYKNNDYDFVGLSDHNTLQEGEEWRPVPDNKIRRGAYEKYLAKFGDEWVDFREDSSGLQVRLKTLEEYRGRFEEPGSFLILKNEEITDRFDGKPVHINATNVAELIRPAGGNSMVEVMQNNINAVLAQREATGQPMFPHINHPNFGWAITAEDMQQLTGERFFEVYNGHPAVNNYGDSARLGTEAMWDQINIHYLQNDQPLMYGLAVDDSHNYHLFGGQYSNTGRGWVMVDAAELTPEALVLAMEAGDFYASTGVMLEKYRVRNRTISLSVKAEPGASYTIDLIGWKTDALSTSILESVSGTEATFTVPADIGFARVKITSDQLQENPFREGDLESAWTQPVSFNFN